MQVLEARVEDIPELCELLGYLFEQEEEFKPDKNLQINGLQKILNSSDENIILILKDGGITLGMVSLLFTVSTALGGTVAILEDMVLVPTKRGQGYGSKLLLSAIEYAKKRECKRITLLTDTANMLAQKFYTRHGFRQSQMIPMRFMFDAEND